MKTQQAQAADVEKAIQALIKAEVTNLGIEVTLPVAFGDGELVTVVIEAKDDGFAVHDAGFSSMRLTAAGVSLTRNVVHRLSEFANRYRCMYADGRVSARADIESLSQVACLVANASRSVADYVYELRAHAEHDFRSAVLETIREVVGNRVRDAEDFTGVSGRRWRVPILLDPTQTRAQNFVAIIAHRQMVTQNFAMLYDLGRKYQDIESDAVYDDAADIREEDCALISSSGAKLIAFMEAQRRFREIAAHG